MTETVSIVIVSMNRLANLDRCLPSIEKYTTTPHCIYVVAYLFSDENLEKLRLEYPYVHIIVSNEIRGFAENNNLALAKVTTPYTFVLNDDTEFTEPVLDNLLRSLEITKDATVMSPVLYRGDGSVQFHGRRKYTFHSFLLHHMGIRVPFPSKYENKNGIYKSYNISGAAFLIYTDIFKKVGFFDEKFFFCPEDIALSTLLNKNGLYCYVDSSVRVIHYEGISSHKTDLFYATTSAAYLGDSYYFGTTIIRRLIILMLWIFKVYIFEIRRAFHCTTHVTDYLYIYKQVLRAYKREVTPKALFIEEYYKVKG
jgi:GT2 family glycosyltransferase